MSIFPARVLLATDGSAEAAPDEEIVKAAENLEAGLIVVGSRGFGAVARSLLGSTSNSIVRHAHCPVLVIRDEEEELS